MGDDASSMYEKANTNTGRNEDALMNRAAKIRA